MYKEGHRVERNSRVKHAEAGAVKACVTPGKRGAGVEKKSGVKHAQVWVV